MSKEIRSVLSIKKDYTLAVSKSFFLKYDSLFIKSIKPLIYLMVLPACFVISFHLLLGDIESPTGKQIFGTSFLSIVAFIVLIIVDYIFKCTSFIKKSLLCLFFSKKRYFENMSKFYPFYRHLMDDSYKSSLSKFKYYNDYKEFVDSFSKNEILKEFEDIDIRMQCYFAEIEHLITVKYINESS